MAKIPESAKQVFAGEIFEVWQWDQEMYDGTTATFERLKRPDTCEVFVVIDDKIIIQRQQQPDRPHPFLSIVGGRIEPGEDALTGAKRETLEETGYASDDWEEIAARMPHSKMEWTIYVYIARGAKKVAEQSLDGGEIIELESKTLDELIDLVDRNELCSLEQEVRMDLLRAKYDPAVKAAWKERLFKK